MTECYSSLLFSEVVEQELHGRLEGQSNPRRSTELGVRGILGEGGVEGGDH